MTEPAWGGDAGLEKLLGYHTPVWWIVYVVLCVRVRVYVWLLGGWWERPNSMGLCG